MKTKYAMELLCYKCDRVLPAAEFRLRKRKNEKGYWYEYRERPCRECQIQANKLWREQNKKPSIRWIKNCVECSKVFLSCFVTHGKFCGEKCARRHNTKKYIIKRRGTRQLTLLSVCNKCGLHPPTEKYGGGPRCVECHKQQKNERYARGRKNNSLSYRNNRIYNKQWKIDNPISARLSKRKSSKNRKLRKRGIEGMLTELQWDDILAAWGNQCAYCDVALVEPDGYHPHNATQDHVIPTTHPSCTDTPSNIVPACVMCNSHKSTQPLEDFVGEERYKLVQFMTEYQ